MVFLLLRLSQGAMLAGVFVSSYIVSEYSANTFNSCPAYPAVKLCADLIMDFSGGLEKERALFFTIGSSLLCLF